MIEGQGFNQLRAPGSEPILVEWVAMPHFALSITTRCQQRCVICFEGERGRRWDVPALDVRGHIREASHSVPGIVFMGAESTLHPEFIDLVRYAASLGLQVAVSSNLQRFADGSFLQRCVHAGLGRVEGSFFYPDEKVFEFITRTPGKRYLRLLRALDNLESLSRLDDKPLEDPTRFGVNINFVACSHNIARVREVLDTLSQHMPTAFRLVTFKRLETVTLCRQGEERGGRQAHCEPLDSSWIPSGASLRAGLGEILDSWRWPRTVPVLRDFPLCVSGGHPEHHMDLVFHGRNAIVAQNFGPSQTFVSMLSNVGTLGGASVLDTCEGCSLVDLCHIVTKGRLALHVPGLEPIPSDRDPLDVLRAAGLTITQANNLLMACRKDRQRVRQERFGSAEPGDASCPDPVQVEKLLRLTLERVGHQFGHPSLESVERESQDGWGAVITIELQRGETRIVLQLGPRAVSVPSFESGKRFMIVHTPNTPLRTHSEQQLARLLLRVCERHLP